jgi:hypothetical protein
MELKITALVLRKNQSKLKPLKENKLSKPTVWIWIIL